MILRMNKFALPPVLEPIVTQLRHAGFRALVVGGAVRDALLGRDAKDIDIEVYGISYDRLAEILSTHGRVDLVGTSFGVIKFTPSGPPVDQRLAAAARPGGHTYDFSLPRRDSKIGPSHRDFLSTFDESITPREAASRRDFTINAMAYDPLTTELLDFFGGREDLERRILRATSEAFAEDPLRVLRGMQFACRFNLTLDPATAQMSRAIAGEYSTLPRERIAEEFMKWAVKSPYPGRIAEYLRATGWMVHFPEIAQLFGVPQDPEWHPEGDVGVHTMHVLNEAARIATRDALEDDDRAVLLFAALAHDFAKPATTAQREKDGRLRWTSWGHEPAGGPLARAFLERIGIKNEIVEKVVRLVENHLVHHAIGTTVTPRAVRRLAMRIAPASIEQLVRLIEADASGRPPLAPGLPPPAARIRDAARAEAVAIAPQPPLILGRHVLPYFDDRPGKHIGEVTHAAYEAQADGAFSTEEEALRWLKEYFAHARDSIE
jgi:tRNA nucleotidyltransferase (CCA-adding enzyme)